MTDAPDFRLYHSNGLDLLAKLLANTLRAPVAGRSVLTPDTILIPQVAMRRWLQAALAEQFGVAANLQFLTPGEFVAQALNANLGPSPDDLDVETLHWRLYAALGDAAVLTQPAMATIAAHLTEDNAARRWALAGELAKVFNKYSAWRRQWLLDWDAGGDNEDPQAILWRAVTHGHSHRAQRIGEYLATFERGAALPSGLPERLFAFATLNVSPDVLRVLATQARVGTLHFFLPTPSREYWGDLRSVGARLRAGEDPFADANENPLLRDWGAAGKDFMALMGSYETVHPSAEFTTYADPAPTDKPVSLLRKMQSDVFYHRAVSKFVFRDALDPDDNSLQFHACHTRLREVQVLHDRLRALLDDARFDPPLQPRDIAVLAPDIDAYTPFFAAVFSQAEDGGRIPYAIADTSPMQHEPLAAVFLRLLNLPNSRFGLQELLDLLASAPLAEAAGFAPVDFERLHGWLHAAGARWGLDGAQRARCGAPEDAAFTWQFAVDRLLLGMASGSEDDIAGVAPLPTLEGSALTALDRLLRLLRVLAQHEQLFRQSATPAQWRERLLALLDALLPSAPASRNDQRALERLRKGIVAFADCAARAGVDSVIPMDVVHAYFTQLLSDADTRAPLLTGGVSVARMVPMRLLPFRVICLLGMNDGDFPRSDPAAGLNKLTAEIGAGKRQHGDRSTREDDRFLFLQLLTAAQDVFYLSWLGKDPRDGSAREPSALVCELLANASAYHAAAVKPAPPVVQQLVLQHPLQPFSADAFGAQDARKFSYRASWHPATLQQAATRHTLPAWQPQGCTLPADAHADGELAFASLQRFFKAPAEQFLRQRLTLQQPDCVGASEDIEPLLAPNHGLENQALQHAVFDAMLAGDSMASLLPRLRARARLPSGPLGAQGLAEIEQAVAPYVQVFAHWRAQQVPQTLALACDIDGVRLHGHLQGVYPQGIARLQFGAPNGASVLRNGLDWLLACAAGSRLPFFEFHQDPSGNLGPHLRAAVSQEAAIAALRSLLALRQQGLQAPLVFAPYSSWLLFNVEDVGKGIKAATEKWRGSERRWAEASAPAYQLALRSRDPFASTDAMTEFARISGEVFGLVTAACAKDISVHGHALPEQDDAEDAA
jgi:exodeoxyribonuclease V gamma subunit